MTPKRVLLVGAGGLACAAAPVLARAGAGVAGGLRVDVIDDDRVEASNLHRQVLHPGAAVGQPKAASLARAIAGLGGSARPIEARLAVDNALALVEGADLVLDGSDNFATRFLVNDACVLLGVPLVHAAAIRWQGQLLAVDPGRGGPCYRCLFEAPPAPGPGLSCAEAGVCGPVVGLVGAVAAEVALERLRRGPGEATAPGGGGAVGELRTFDGLRGAWRTVRFRKNPGCLACGEAPLAQLPPPSAYEVPLCSPP